MQPTCYWNGYHGCAWDQRRSEEGNGRAEIIFSNHNMMSYDDIRDYLRLLIRKHETDPQKIQIYPAVIDPERIRSVEHSRLAGLQVTNAVASGIHFRGKGQSLGGNGNRLFIAFEKDLVSPSRRTAGLWHQALARELRHHKNKSPRSRKHRRLVTVGPRNRGSHPFRLPLARSGLYLSCACQVRIMM